MQTAAKKLDLAYNQSGKRRDRRTSEGKNNKTGFYVNSVSKSSARDGNLCARSEKSFFLVIFNRIA